MMFFRTVIFPALLLNAGLAFSSTISGTVRDTEGAVIGKARITIHRDSTNGKKEGADLVVTSDKNGEFVLKVDPGFYDIFVSAPAFSPQCTKINVSGSEPGIYMPRLHADPLVTKERGDTFSH